MTMYDSSPQQDLLPMELPLTPSAAGSLARTYHLQEKAQGLPVSVAAYGLSTPELLARYDPNSLSWRTSQHCLVEGLEEFSETYPRSGMMRNGIAYQLQPLVRLTDETGFGLLPTPSASDPQLERRARVAKEPHLTKNGTVRNGKSNLGLPGMMRLWPTPTVCGLYNRKGASATSGDGLATAVRMWPTPTAHNAKEGGFPSEHLRNTPTLAAQAGGALNPPWVEWLMGFPIGHTDLKL